MDIVKSSYVPELVRDRTEWWVLTLDNYIAKGDPPQEALANTVTDYAYVFHGGPSKQEFSRAAEVALKFLTG